MNSGNNNWVNKFYTVIMPKIYGIGAAVVIAGAMFKLLNWSGGALMLGVGLTTEAIIFFLSSFEPPAKEVDWAKVYPELSEDSKGASHVHRNQVQSVDSISEKLDDMFAKAKVDGALLERLGQGMHHLAESAIHIADLTHAAQVTSKYTVNLEKASEALESMYVSQSNVLSAMHKLDGLAEHTQNFHQGLQGLTETLNRANVAYNTELQEIYQTLEGTKAMYVNVSDSMSQLQEASSETENFRLELSNLNAKLSSLNNIYGNMLTALKS